MRENMRRLLSPPQEPPTSLMTPANASADGWNFMFAGTRM
jgi:hypothetical protein